MFDNLTPQPNNTNLEKNSPSSSPSAELASVNYPADKPTPIQPGGAPGNEPEDIFSGTEASDSIKEKPAQLQPKTVGVGTAIMGSTPAAPISQNKNVIAGKKSNKKMIIVIIIVVILFIVLAGMIALAYFKSNFLNENQLINGTTQNTTDNSSSDEVNLETNLNSEEEDLSYIMEEIMDTDNDGLFDAEEKRLGTDPQKADTDNDGLFDREEIRVYNTDPLNPDTDYDDYTDGQEVQNGYNPAGPGKLSELP